MNEHILFKFKKTIKDHTKLSHTLYAVYLRLLFVHRTLWSFWVNLIIRWLKFFVVRGDIGSLIIGESGIQLRLYGKTFHWNPADRNSLLGIACTGTYEKGELDHMLKHIKPGMVVMDIGANFGFHTVLFADRTGPSGHVYGFEPLSSAYRELKENISLNGLGRRITVENLGLSNKPGTASLYVAQELGSGATSLKRRWDGTNLRQVCRLTTVDNYVVTQKIGRVDFIKCDVEGAELAVFQGAQKTLAKYKPTLFFEAIGNHTSLFDYTVADLIHYIQSFSYTVYWVDEEAKLTKSIDARNGNYLALPVKK